MKKLSVIVFLLVSGFLFNTVHAQVNVSVNIGVQPEWGPTGYDHVEYYYLPDLDIYYHVPDHRFYYMSGNQWRYSTTLPAKYRNIDLYTVHKVVVNGENPFQQHAAHQKQYASFKNQHDQQPIRDVKEEKYTKSKNNWQHNRFQKSPDMQGGRDNKNNGNRDRRTPDR
jgi:hypothetical protein